LRKLKDIKIGDDNTKYDRDMNMLRAFPKADLHSHLGGVLSPEEIIETALAEEKSAENSEWKKTIFSTEHAVHEQQIEKLNALKTKLFALKSKDFRVFYGQLIVFITAFQKDIPLFKRMVFGDYESDENYCAIGIDPYQRLGDFQGSSLLQTKNTIAEALVLYAEKLIKDNTRYVEIRCSPYKYTQMGLSENDVVNIIMDTMEKYADKIEYRLICIIGRESGIQEIEGSIQKIDTLLQENSRFAKKLAGIDLAGNEGRLQPMKLREAFMPFLEKCIHITIHAGETESVDNIWQAVYHLSADRIGHGLKLHDKLELIPRFIDRNIGIEMCPSSNDQIVGYRNGGYPLKEYMKQGLKVTVNTDNPGISRTSVSEEFYKAACLCGGLSIWDCLVLIRNSLSVAFAHHQTKLWLLRSFEDELHDWCIEHVPDLL
jgi:adenosine deaminase